MIRRLLPLAVMLAVGVGLANASGPPISPEPTDHVVVEIDQPLLIEHNANHRNIITWNMCEAVCVGGEASPGDLMDVYGRAERRPRAIAVQEMCDGGWDYLRDKLADANYQAARRITNPGAICNETGDHGNGIFWVGGCNAPCRISDRFQHQQDSVDDLRGFACGASANYNFTACTAHMDTGDAHAGQQGQEYRALGAFLGSLPPSQADTIHLAGDLNIHYCCDDNANPPLNFYIAPWYDNFWEADICIWFACQPTLPNGNKLDYIFFNDFGPHQCSRAHNAFVRDTTDSSDHYLLRAYFAC